LPILYFTVAHVALVLAFAAVAVDARAVAGFFYHSRTIAIVHLITLGWITGSILGSLYLVGPIALRVRLPANWVDYLAFLLVSVGSAGMVTHFWVGEYSGMAWSGIMVGFGIVTVGARHARRLAAAPIPRAVRVHIALAFVNILGAAVMGILLGFNRIQAFLPGFVLTNVYAHAHLAAIGWASLMVIGVGYRLLPMVLPAAMPSGAALWATALLLEMGVAGLFASLIARGRWTATFAVVIVCGFAVFFGQGLWMLRHPRPRPPAIRTPDPALLHAGFAFICLAIACGMGLWLSIAPTSASTLRIAAAYGVVGLVGFLAQMVVAMEARLLPLFAWYWATANTGGGEPAASPHDMAWRPAQFVAFGLWLFGLPMLAGGLALDMVGAVRAAAWALLASAVLDSLHVALVLRHAYVRPPGTKARIRIHHR
jgi:hypothetical protein